MCQFNGSKNLGINFNDLTCGSSRKINWICNKGHEWVTRPADRIDKKKQRIRNCPYCSNNKINTENSLASLNPTLAAEWHPVKNGKITPFDVGTGSNKKVWWKCSEGHEWQSAVFDRHQGSNCRKCYDKRRGVERRLPYEFVKKAFEMRGYLLIDKEYLNSETPLRYQCPIHHDKDLKIRYNDLKKGKGCPYCANCKVDFEDVEKVFQENGYKLLETSYINSSTKMRYECPNHPDKELYITYAHMYSGHGCPYCSGKAKHEIEYVRDVFKEKGYTLLEEEYINNKSKMRYQCPHHPDKELYMVFADILYNDSGCPYCAGLAKHDIEHVREKFKNAGLVLLEEEYPNANTPMACVCPKHSDKELTMTYASVYSGHGCKYCAYELNSGENHPFWKGGITSIKNYLRGKIIKWKKDSMRNCDYRCVLTGYNFEVIHHLYSFESIIQELFYTLDIEIKKDISMYSQKELELLEEKCLEIHYRHPLGVCLTKDAHTLFHSLYGREQNTPEQFEEFKQHWNDGEFKNLEAI